MSQRWMLLVLLVLLAGLPVLRAQDANAPDSRTYQPPDSNYRFTYPLDSYSVRAGCPCMVPNQGQDILFPGIIEIAPNDSLVYRDGQGIVFNIRIAAVAPENVRLDASLFGSGPLLGYDASLIDADDVQEIELGGVPALRVDDLPVGVSGAATDILVVDAGLLYEIVIEPVNPGAGGGVKGRNLVRDILDSFEFIPLP